MSSLQIKDAAGVERLVAATAETVGDETHFSPHHRDPWVEALATSMLAKLSADPATQTTLAAILAKLIAAPSTEAKQDTTISAIATLIGHVDGLEASLTSILAKIIAAPATEAKQDTLIAKDFATQTTLAAVLAKIIAAPATEAKQDTALAATNTIGTRTYGTAATRLAYSGTSAQSAAITGTEVLLHNCGTARCYVKAGSDPTATANDIPLEAGEKFHMRITTSDKIAALQDSASGNLNIIPVA